MWAQAHKLKNAKVRINDFLNKQETFLSIINSSMILTSFFLKREISLSDMMSKSFNFYFTIPRKVELIVWNFKIQSLEFLGVFFQKKNRTTKTNV